MLLTLDIETLPSKDPVVIAKLESKIKAPANYSKPETIAKWMEENKESALREAVHKTGFSGLHGSIACICYAFDDGEVFSVDVNTSGSEKNMLEHFYSHVYDKTTIEHHSGFSDLSVTVVGHNVAAFDLPFIKHRSIINGVKPIAVIRKAMDAKPWDGCIADTMLMWSADRERRASMDDLCNAFGIPGKGDFSGAMVAETWPADHKKVIDYCIDDVERTRQIYKRMTFQTLPTSRDLFKEAA